jgi:hypothetical protein
MTVGLARDAGRKRGARQTNSSFEEHDDDSDVGGALVDYDPLEEA